MCSLLSAKVNVNFSAVLSEDQVQDFIDYIVQKINNKYILVIHNNPQSLRGAVTAKERKKLIKICSKNNISRFLRIFD